jgi:ADP-heptose:LPS heptosyltransferase
VRGPAEEAFTVAASGFDVLDQPTLKDLAATLAHSRLVIGNDSGVSHLAGAVGAPSIAIYGPTSDRVWRPDGAQVHTIRAPSGELAAVLVEKVLAVCGELTGLARKDAS